jgi:hypothetical protein
VSPRGLDVGRARPMEDRDQRAEETVEGPDFVDDFLNHSPGEMGPSVDHDRHGGWLSVP